MSIDDIDDIDKIRKIDPETLAEPQPDKIHKKEQLLRDKATYENEVAYAQSKLDRTNAMLAKF